MKDRTFLVVVSAQEGLVTLRLASAPAVGEAMLDNLEQTQEVAAEVQAWAEGARPGDYLDAPCGWVFCVSGEATEVAERTREKAKARA
jgi:hypothetical protein